MPLLINLAVMFIAGYMAQRKGYSFWLWFFAAGVPGLLVILFLPDANLPGQSESKQEDLRRQGNYYAVVLMVVGVALFFYLYSRIVTSF